MTTHFLEIIKGLSPSNGVIGRTLADCQAVAAMFDNTCDISQGAVDLTSHVGAKMSCTG